MRSVLRLTSVFHFHLERLTRPHIDGLFELLEKDQECGSQESTEGARSAVDHHKTSGTAVPGALPHVTSLTEYWGEVCYILRKMIDQRSWRAR